MAQVNKLLKKNLIVLLILAVLVFLVYSNSLPNKFVTDDEGLVKEGRNLINFGHIFGEPSVILRRVVYAFIYLTAGLQPWAYRLVTILFHIGNSFLIYLIVKKIINPKVALLSAILFSIHPLLGETVVWISGGGYAQMSFFFLMSFWFYLKGGKPWRYVLSLALFGLCLLSMNRALVLAGVFPLYEFCFPNKSGGLKKHWRRYLPFLIVGGLWLITFSGALGERATSLEKVYYRDGLFYNPLIQLPLAIGSYLNLIFWPEHLTYVHTNAQSTLGYIARSLVLVVYLGSLIYTFLKKREYFFWLVFFLIPLLPFLTPLKIAFIVAERYAYLGTLGILVLISIFILKLTAIKEIKIAVYFLLLVLIIGLMVRGVVRNTDWASPEKLWEKTAEVSGDSSQAHLNLGVKYGNEKQYDLAEKEFIAAIQINPKIAEYHYNLGVLYAKTKKYAEALESFNKALELKPGYEEAKKAIELLKSSKK